MGLMNNDSMNFLTRLLTSFAMLLFSLCITAMLMGFIFLLVYIAMTPYGLWLFPITMFLIMWSVIYFLLFSF
jgi:hypothetical protein